MGTRSLLPTTFLCSWTVLLLLPVVVVVRGIPHRGNEPWTLILCKFADLSHYEPKPISYFQDWLTGPDDDSIENYFAQVSNGVYTISGSNVVGWLTLPYSQKDVLAMANAEASAPIGSDSSFDYFDKIKEVCVQSALKSGLSLHRQRITVINAGTTAVYGKKNGVLLTPRLMFSSVLTHEMVHSFFIGHSYSDRRIKIFPYAMFGEYDDRYDLLSTANAYMHRSTFGMSGPGLNGAHLDFLGWLPMDRMLYFGRDGRQNYTLRLSSLSVPHNSTRGWLLIMIPFDRNDPRNFYTIELRTPNLYDRGISQPAVLIHRVQRSGGSYYSVLISQAQTYYELTEGTEWVTFLEQDLMGRFQSIRVSVRKMYSTDADVTVVSTFDPDVCRMGELRKMVIETRYGVNFVCMPRVRSHSPVLEADLQRQFAYRNFFALRPTFGANECREGFVWRAIDAHDFVCVPPHRQETAQQQLDVQSERTRNVAVSAVTATTTTTTVVSSAETRVTEAVPSASPAGLDVEEEQEDDECLPPYVPRAAFVGDAVCVSEREKGLTLRENLDSVNFLRHYEFFNGVDTVGP